MTYFLVKKSFSPSPFRVLFIKKYCDPSGEGMELKTFDS